MSTIKHNKIKLREVNRHLVCRLCRGYYVDATTIAECLHSFCRSCIIKYLEKNSFCPICEVQIHKTKPYLSLRLDKALQDVVYKVVPGLYHDEMKRRREFYSVQKEQLPSTTPEQCGLEERIIFSPEDSISLSLEYLDSDYLESETVSSQSSDSGDTQENFALSQHLNLKLKPNDKSSRRESQDTQEPSFYPKRYLQCPAVVNIGHLKKFVKMKHELHSHSQVDIIHKRVPLPDHYTLMDVAYIYTWKRSAPLRLFYQIYRTKKQKVVVPTSLPEAKNTEPHPIKDLSKEKCEVSDNLENSSPVNNAVKVFKNINGATPNLGKLSSETQKPSSNLVALKSQNFNKSEPVNKTKESVKTVTSVNGDVKKEEQICGKEKIISPLKIKNIDKVKPNDKMTLEVKPKIEKISTTISSVQKSNGEVKANKLNSNERLLLNPVSGQLESVPFDDYSNSSPGRVEEKKDKINGLIKDEDGKKESGVRKIKLNKSESEIIRKEKINKKDSGETKKDSGETKKDSSEIKKVSSETKKDASKIKKVSGEMKKDSSEMKKLACEVKKDSSEMKKEKPNRKESDILKKIKLNKKEPVSLRKEKANKKDSENGRKEKEQKRESENAKKENEYEKALECIKKENELKKVSETLRIEKEQNKEFENMKKEEREKVKKQGEANKELENLNKETEPKKNSENLRKEKEAKREEESEKKSNLNMLKSFRKEKPLAKETKIELKTSNGSTLTITALPRTEKPAEAEISKASTEVKEDTVYDFDKSNSPEKNDLFGKQLKNTKSKYLVEHRDKWLAKEAAGELLTFQEYREMLLKENNATENVCTRAKRKSVPNLFRISPEENRRNSSKEYFGKPDEIPKEKKMCPSIYNIHTKDEEKKTVAPKNNVGSPPRPIKIENKDGEYFIKQDNPEVRKSPDAEKQKKDDKYRFNQKLLENYQTKILNKKLKMDDSTAGKNFGAIDLTKGETNSMERKNGLENATDKPNKKPLKPEEKPKITLEPLLKVPQYSNLKNSTAKDWPSVAKNLSPNDLSQAFLHLKHLDAINQFNPNTVLEQFAQKTGNLDVLYQQKIDFIRRLKRHQHAADDIAPEKRQKCSPSEEKKHSPTLDVKEKARPNLEVASLKNAEDLKTLSRIQDLLEIQRAVTQNFKMPPALLQFYGRPRPYPSPIPPALSSSQTQTSSRPTKSQSLGSSSGSLPLSISNASFLDTPNYGHLLSAAGLHTEMSFHQTFKNYLRRHEENPQIPNLSLFKKPSKVKEELEKSLSDNHNSQAPVTKQEPIESVGSPET